MRKPVGPLRAAHYPAGGLSTGHSPVCRFRGYGRRLVGMDAWREERAREIRAQLKPQDEASLWVLFLDDPHGAPILAAPIEGAMDHLDRQLLVNLAMVIDNVGSKAVLLAIPRRGGTLEEADRQLWQDIQKLLADSPVELLDLLVVASTKLWSARDSRV